MDTARRVTKNSFFVLTARVTEVVFNLVVFALVARYLGIEGFGVYSFVIATIWILSPILFLGLNQILARDVALNPEKTAIFIGNGMILNMLMTIPILILVIAIINIFNMSSEAAVALFITVVTFISRAFIRNFFGVIIASEKMKHLTSITVITRASELLMIFAIVILDLGFINLFVASCVAEVLGFIACLILFRKIFAMLKIEVNAKEIWNLFKDCLPVALSLLLIEAFLYIDIFVLKLLASDTDIGLFQGPHKILTRIQALPMAIFIAFLPLYSRLAGSQETIDKFNSLFIKTFRLILTVTLPLSVIGVIFSENIIVLLFGKEFSAAGYALQILILALPFLCLTTHHRYLFISLKKQRLIVASDAIGVVCKLLLGVMLIPSFGFIGASIGTLIAIIVQFAMNYLFLIKHFGSVVWQRDIAGPICSTLVFALFMLGFGKQASLILLPFGLILYFVTLLIFKTFSTEDIYYFKRSIGF